MEFNVKKTVAHVRIKQEPRNKADPSPNYRTYRSYIDTNFSTQFAEIGINIKQQ